MKRITCCLVLIAVVNCPDVFGQRKAKPKIGQSTPSNTHKIDDLPFVSPVYVRLGLHRQTEPALFISIKNEGRNLSINRVSAIIVVIDALKMRVIRSYAQDFDFAIPVGPKSTGEAVATKQDGFWLSINDLVLSACKQYEVAKEDPTFFVPGSCISNGDTLTFRIAAISYTDGTNWIAPKHRTK